VNGNLNVFLRRSRLQHRPAHLHYPPLGRLCIIVEVRVLQWGQSRPYSIRNIKFQTMPLWVKNR
jgi:hypothetical protein